jgi:hypothetical protein
MKNFQVSTERINGREIKIVRELQSVGKAGAYTDDLKGDNRLGIFCSNCQNLDEKVQMLRTLKL